VSVPQHLFGLGCRDRACAELLQSEFGDEQFVDYVGHIGGVAKSRDGKRSRSSKLISERYRTGKVRGIGAPIAILRVSQ